MNKQEAAEFLGVSVRALERYTQQGKIGVRYEKGKTRPTPVYDEEELARFKPEIEAKLYPHRPSVAPPASVANADNTETALARVARTPNAEGLITLIKALRETEQRPKVSIEGKLVLKRRLFTELPRGILREAIDAGKLEARIIGRAWRVKRTDLDVYVRKL